MKGEGGRVRGIREESSKGEVGVVFKKIQQICLEGGAPTYHPATDSNDIHCHESLTNHLPQLPTTATYHSYLPHKQLGIVHNACTIS